MNESKADSTNIPVSAMDKIRQCLYSCLTLVEMIAVESISNPYLLADISYQRAKARIVKQKKKMAIEFILKELKTIPLGSNMVLGLNRTMLRDDISQEKHVQFVLYFLPLLPVTMSVVDSSHNSVSPAEREYLIQFLQQVEYLKSQFLEKSSSDLKLLQELDQSFQSLINALFYDLRKSIHAT